MNRASILVVFLAALASFACVRAAGAAPETGKAAPELLLAIHLRDGSLIVGVPATNAVAVRTSYARMDVLLGLMNGITFSDDGETCDLAFRSGDRVQGVIDAQALTLHTLMGEISIRIELVRSIDVLRGGGAAMLLDKALCAYYPFDGNLADKSGRNRDGTMTGPLAYVRGVSGRALAFGKDGAPNLLNIPNSCTGAQFTVSFWLLVDKPEVHNSLVMITRGRDWPASDLWIFTSHGRLALLSSRRDLRYHGGTRNLLNTFADSALLAAKKACHVAYTFSNGTACYYLDGAKYAAYDNVPPPPTSATTILLGACPPGTDYKYPLAGWLDELRIYGRALADNEIKSIYNALRDD
jgi:hypothetical protein